MRIAKVSLNGIFIAPLNFFVFQSGTNSIRQLPSCSPPITGDLLTILITPPIVFLPNKTPWVPLKTSTLSISIRGEVYWEPCVIGIPSINVVIDCENPLLVPDPIPLI